MSEWVSLPLFATTTTPSFFIFETTLIAISHWMTLLSPFLFCGSIRFKTLETGSNLSRDTPIALTLGTHTYKPKILGTIRGKVTLRVRKFQHSGSTQNSSNTYFCVFFVFVCSNTHTGKPTKKKTFSCLHKWRQKVGLKTAFCVEWDRGGKWHSVFVFGQESVSNKNS